MRRLVRFVLFPAQHLRKIEQKENILLIKLTLKSIADTNRDQGQCPLIRSVPPLKKFLFALAILQDIKAHN